MPVIENQTELFNLLSPEQIRHVVVVENIVQLAKLYKDKCDAQENEASYAIAEAMECIAKTIGTDSVYEKWTENYRLKINSLLFEEIESKTEEQKIVYQAALATSKWHLEKYLMENNI